MEAWLKAALVAHPCKALDGGVFRTAPIRVSFPALFEPKQQTDEQGNVNGKPKYGLTMLIPLGADITVLRQAHAAMEAKEFPDYKGKLFKPFRDQGDKGHLAGYTSGSLFFGARTEGPPQVRKAVNGKLVAVRDPADVYAGCWALVTVHLFAFGKKKDAKQRGVTFGLNNVLKIRDDEPFGGGGTDADAEFADAPVDLNDGSGVTIDDLM